MILDARTGQPYYDLSEILKDKNYYILTSFMILWKHYIS